MKKIVKDTLILFLITVISGLLLGWVYKITKDPIAEQNEKTKLNAYKSVFSDMETVEELDDAEIAKASEAVKAEKYNGVTVNAIAKAIDKDGNYLGMIITVTDSDGYGGDIEMTIGIDKNSTITGLEFLELNETAGLGMNAKNASFKNQFVGMNSEYVKYTKDGKSSSDEFDAISCATITSSAVADGVNGALISFRAVGGAANE